MKVSFVLAIIASSVFSEALPYPPSGYRPIGPQFELPSRENPAQSDVETFTDSVIIDNQYKLNGLSSTYQTLPVRESIKFRPTFESFDSINFKSSLPGHKMTMSNFEFYKLPVFLLRTEINYPVDFTRAGQPENEMRKNIDPINNNDFGLEHANMFENNLAPANGNYFMENNLDVIDSNDELMNIPHMRLSRFRSAVHRKSARPSKVEAGPKTTGRVLDSEDLEQNSQQFETSKTQNAKSQSIRVLKDEDDNVSLSMEDQQERNVRPATKIRKLRRRKSRGKTATTTSSQTNLEDFMSQKIERKIQNENLVVNHSPHLQYGPPPDVTVKKPRRKIPKKPSTTTTTVAPITEESEIEQDFSPNDGGPNVAISTAIAGLPPPFYLVQRSSRGKIRFLRLPAE